MARGIPGGPDSYTTRMDAIGLLAGVMMPLFCSIGGCGREASPATGLGTYREDRPAAAAHAPPSRQEGSVAPAEAPAGVRFLMLFDDYTRCGSPSLLAIATERNGGRLIYADPDGDGKWNWITDMEDLGGLRLYSMDERGEIIPDKALPMDVESGDFFGGRHPSSKEKASICAPSHAWAMAAGTDAGTPFYFFKFSDDASVFALTNGDRCIDFVLKRGSYTVSLPGSGNMNSLSWDASGRQRGSNATSSPLPKPEEPNSLFEF